MSKTYSHLFSPFSIGKLEIKNRYVMSPMALLHLSDEYAAPTDDAIAYYTERAKGGFGLIMIGASRTDQEVDPQAIPSVLKNPMVYMPRMQTLAERIHTYGAKIIPQISLGPGRLSPGCFAPSELPGVMPGLTSPVLTTEQVKTKISYMVKAAGLLSRLGVDGVEIHAMHWGHLIDQFAMAITNNRTDEYGGELEGRLRVAKEIVQGIKQVCGANFPVSIRLALKSYMKGFMQPSLTGEDEAGRTIEETVEVAKLLESYGYDVLNCDVGTTDSMYYPTPPMYAEEGFIIPLAAQVKAAVSIPVIAGGGRLNDPDPVEDALASGMFDAVAIGRASLADPELPGKIYAGVPESIRPCIGCNQACIGALELMRDSSCSVNPRAAREQSYGLSKALTPKSIAVLGGGVSGMEFARTATLRGHRVTLFEKAASLGGHLVPGGHHYFKSDVNDLNAWYRRELEELGVDVKLGSAPDADAVKALGVDAVVLATGSSPITLPIPGADDPKVASGVAVLRGEVKVGERVAVIGGGLVGCEIALDLAKGGKEVTVVEALPDIIASGAPVPNANRRMLIDLLEANEVKILKGHKIKAVSAEGAVVEGSEGAELTIEADTVIMSIGFRPTATTKAEEFADSGIEVRVIGDGRKVGNIMTAVWDAYEIARSI